MTATSDAIEAAVGRRPLFLQSDHQFRVVVLEPMRVDPVRGATVAALISSGTAERLIRGMRGASASAFIEMVGGSVTPAGLPRIRRVIRESQPWASQKFELSYDLHTNYRKHGFTKFAAPEAKVVAVVPSDLSAPFTGSGATGINPTEVRVPLMDQYRMWRDNADTIEKYSNPLFDLFDYLATMTTEQRMRQGEILTGQPISSVVPDSYAPLPSRMAMLEAAATQHNLHKELIAAFVLAEQRDQSQREDGKDYTAARSILKGNTSIGLGQVVVSTARRNDLFRDLLSQPYRANLSHAEIGLLLASDEFNLFAVARYIRLTADHGASAGASKALPDTRAQYPDIDFAAYRRNSRDWPDDNIMALGSEYTSAPWDDKLAWGWGEFVYEAYLDLVGHPALGAASPAAAGRGGARRGRRPAGARRPR